MKFKAHFVQKLKIYKGNLVLVIDNKVANIILNMTGKAKIQANSMTTQYFEYGNTIIDISEHQYHKMQQSSKMSQFISCIRYIENKIVV